MHPSQRQVLEVTNSDSWMKFWDTALEHGVDGTRASLSILKLMCLTVFTDRKCPIESCSYIVPPDSPLFLQSH